MVLKKNKNGTQFYICELCGKVFINHDDCDAHEIAELNNAGNELLTDLNTSAKVHLLKELKDKWLKARNELNNWSASSNIDFVEAVYKVASAKTEFDKLCLELNIDKNTLYNKNRLMKRIAMHKI